MTSNAWESIGAPSRLHFPKPKTRKNEMNDMKRFLPFLILAVSVCTGCRTGTVQPERKTTSSVPSAPTTQTAKLMCDIANSGSQSQSSVASAPTTQTAKLMCDIANSGSQSQSSVSIPAGSLNSTASGLSEALATATEANSEAPSLTNFSPSKSFTDALIDAAAANTEAPTISMPLESLDSTSRE